MDEQQTMLNLSKTETHSMVLNNEMTYLCLNQIIQSAAPK
jgi:hypothetical protein